MFGIKYLSRVKPESKFDIWRKTASKNWFEDAIKMYIFNDLIATLVHVFVMIVLGIFVNYDESFINYFYLFGVLPFLANFTIGAIFFLLTNKKYNKLLKNNKDISHQDK